jgi:hypothetical protein
MSRIRDATATSEEQVQLFMEDLNRASARVLQALQDLASRVDPMFGIDLEPSAVRNRDVVPANHSKAGTNDLVSSLSRAFDRSVTLTVTEIESEYCRGAIALQNSTTRSIEDISVDGTARMQYTYVCKFCFLHISSYQRLARTWETYEWRTLAMSHVVACTSWLDSRAFFKCIDCHRHGVEAVCIDANDFFAHTQEHLQGSSKPKVSRRSAYSQEGDQNHDVPQRRPYGETMAEVEKEIAAYEKVIEMELAEDPKVQKAKEAAVPLVEEDDDDDEIDEWYHPQRKPHAKESVRVPETPQTPFVPARHTLSNGKRDVSPLRSDYGDAPNTFQNLPSPPPYQSSPHVAQTATQRFEDPVKDVKVPPVPIYQAEPLKEIPAVQKPAYEKEKEVSNPSHKAPRTAPTPGQAVYEKDVTPSVPSPRRAADTRTQAPSELADDGFISCPGCDRRVRAEALDEHLDTTCPSNADNGSTRVPQTKPKMHTIPQQQPLPHTAPDYVPSNAPTHLRSESKAGSTQAASVARPTFTDYDTYQPGSRAPSLPSGLASVPPPSRPAPGPPVQQVLRKATAAEAEANYQAQRYAGEQATTSPRTPSSQRNSRGLHARDISTPTGSGQRTPQPSGGFQDWQQQDYPSYEKWSGRQ